MLVFIQNIICLKLQVVEIPRELKVVPLFLHIMRAGFNFVRVTQCREDPRAHPCSDGTCLSALVCVVNCCCSFPKRDAAERSKLLFVYIYIFLQSLPVHCQDCTAEAGTGESISKQSSSSVLTQLRSATVLCYCVPP